MRRHCVQGSFDGIVAHRRPTAFPADSTLANHIRDFDIRGDPDDLHLPEFEGESPLPS